jgi:hypothetical protein
LGWFERDNLFNIENLVLGPVQDRACGGQSAMALPVKIASCFGVLEYMKSQTPSTKLQTNLKFQYQMTKTALEFVILVIVIYLLFEICDLEFLVTPADCRKEERPLKPPQGAAQSRVLWARILNLRFFFGYRQIDHEGSTNLGFTGA